MSYEADVMAEMMPGSIHPRETASPSQRQSRSPRYTHLGLFLVPKVCQSGIGTFVSKWSMMNVDQPPQTHTNNDQQGAS